ncbi:hypothetical protein DSECCO2_606810 [anaerobic digester metagenome]
MLMKKLKKIELQEVVVLEDSEMKQIVGGSGSLSCDPDATLCYGACLTDNGLGGVCRKIPRIFNKCGCVQL